MMLERRSGELVHIRSLIHRVNAPVAPSWQSMIDSTLRWREWCVALTAAFVVLGGFFAAWLQPWKISPRYPLVHEGDALGYAMSVRTIIDTGWIQSTNRLGAPFGQTMYDYPLDADNGNYMLLRVLTFFSGDFALVVNAFFAFGFFTVTVSSFIALRMLRSGRRAGTPVGGWRHALPWGPSACTTQYSLSPRSCSASLHLQRQTAPSVHC